jgi:uncharacterized protein YneF (UPF0154 family)
MHKGFIMVAIYFALSILVGLLVGKFIKAGR